MLISFGEFSWYVFFPIGYGVFVVCRMILFSEYTLPKHNSPLNSTFITSIVLLSMGILELILIKNQKHPKRTIIEPIAILKDEDSNQDENKKIINPRTQIEFIDTSTGSFFAKADIINYIIILIIAFTNFWINFFVFNIPEAVTATYINLDTEVKFIGIIYVCFLCKIVLKDEFRKHHIFSLYLIIISDVILCIFNIVVLVVNQGEIVIQLKQMLYSLGMYLITDFYFSSKHVTEKYLMDKRYLSPYRLLFIEGIFSFIINIIVMIVFSFIDCPKLLSYCTNEKMFTFSRFIDMFQHSYIFVIGFFISTFVVELCMTSTSKYYTPALRPIFDTLTTVVQLIYKYNIQTGKEEIDTWVFVIKLIMYAFILIGCLLYNEVIMVGFWGLDKDLKNAIAERARKDYNTNVSKLNHYLQEDNNISKISANSSLCGGI